MLITIQASLARLLIHPRERKIERRRETYEYLENEIQEGRWDQVPPIWITPNYLINGLLRLTFKPFIMYNGHHRLEKAIEHDLLVKAYVRYTFGNPPMPKEEKLLPEIYC